jgi:uncharacterized membrane protein YphA (DoxX/SURF4 family)
MDAPHPSRASSIVAIALGVIFLATSAVKLFGLDQAVALFTAFGLPQWSRVAAGLVELVGAVLVVLPATRPLGGLVLCAAMAGAVLAHILTAVALPLLLVNFVLFIASVWLVMRDRPSFLRIDWAHDSHRSA